MDPTRIDLRSDTVTLPTESMRRAMAEAVVGDDVYGEDPTVNALETEAARLLGKEAALFVASGTMGNLIAVKCHTQPGQEVILEETSHILLFEMGGMGWFSGVIPRTVRGERGMLDPEAVRRLIRKDVPYFLSKTGLICLENTHNCAGGTISTSERLAEIRRVATEYELPIHLDGARLFNAAAALGCPVAELAQWADSVMVCLSKGLSAPVGSLLSGSSAFISRAREVRRVVGGGMRQAGVLAAAGLVALREEAPRLAQDHVRCRELATGLATLPDLVVDPAGVETNILMLRHRGGPDGCAALVRNWKEAGVWVSQLSVDTVRLVTHRHIDDKAVARTLAVAGASSARG